MSLPLQQCRVCGGFALRLRDGLCRYDWQQRRDDTLTFEHDAPAAAGPLAGAATPRPSTFPAEGCYTGVGE